MTKILQVCDMPQFNHTRYLPGAHNAFVFSQVAPFSSQNVDLFYKAIRSGRYRVLELDISVGDNGRPILAHRDQSIFGIFANPFSGALPLETMVPWVLAMLDQGDFSIDQPLLLSLDITPRVKITELIPFFKKHFFTVADSLLLTSTDAKLESKLNTLSHQTGIRFLYNPFKTQSLKLYDKAISLKSLRTPGKLLGLVEKYGEDEIIKVINNQPNNTLLALHEGAFGKFSQKELLLIKSLSEQTKWSYLIKADNIDDHSLVTRQSQPSFYQNFIPVDSSGSRSDEFTLTPLPYGVQSISVLTSTTALLVVMLAVCKLKRFKRNNNRAKLGKAIHATASFFTTLLYCFTSYAIFNYSLAGLSISSVALSLLLGLQLAPSLVVNLARRSFNCCNGNNKDSIIIGAATALLLSLQTSLMLFSAKYQDHLLQTVVPALLQAMVSPFLLPLALWSAFKTMQRCIDSVKKRCLNNLEGRRSGDSIPAVGLSPAPEMQLP